MRIEVRCRRCGRAFEPDRRAIVLGRWRIYPDCQDLLPTGGVPVSAELRSHRSEEGVRR